MSYKVRNVNIAYELLLEAAEDYSGFILGLKEGSVVNAIFGTAAAEGEGKTDPDELEIDKAKRRFFTKVLDRTNGALCLNDIDGAAKKELGAVAEEDVQSLITVVHGANELIQPGGSVMPQNDDTMGLNEFEGMFFAHGMSSVLKTIDHNLISRTKTEIKPDAGQNSERSEDDPKKFKITVPAVGNADANLVNTLLNGPISNKEIDRFEHPSFGSITVKHPAFGFAARQALHLPVFLGAVTPIEMSRCTPFLDVKILTRKRPRAEAEESGRKKLGIWNFLRIQAPKESDAWSGDKGPYPVDSTLSENPEYTERYYNYMDIFQSPQTMVNPNANTGAGIFDRISEAVKEDKPFEAYLGGEEFSFGEVKDPMQPFLSLVDFNISITGIGHGLMATKKAFLKIKLHDKSRIKDLAEFLSPDDFAFTKFVIEFGWSHPDGSVTSQNKLGRYLDALRDASIYQLVSADYSFGQDNSVDITLKLVASGFQQMKMISAAGGRHTNLATFQGTIDNMIKEMANRKIAKAEKVAPENTQKLKEIRSKLKITNRNLRSKSMLIPFQDANDEKSNLLALKTLLNDTNIDEKDAVKKILSLLFGEYSKAEDIDISSYSAIVDQSSDGPASDGFDHIPLHKIYILLRTAS